MKPTLLMLSLLTTPLLLTACGSDTSAEKEEAPLRPVRFEQVSATGGNALHYFSGTTQAASESVLSFKVAGLLNHLAVNVGDQVKAGQLLASLDEQDFSLKRQQAEAGLQRAQAEERNAKARYERTRQLYEVSNASLNDLDAARAAADANRASVSSAEKQLSLAQRQLEYSKLTAPGHCRIAAIHVEQNENLKPGGQVMTLACGEQLEVTAAIPEAYIARIRQGDSAQIKLPAIQQTINASVVEVGIATGKQGTSYPVTLLLNQRPEGARAGMSAEVGMTLNSGSGNIAVPAYAVGEDENGRYLFVIQAGGNELGQVVRRKVSVGSLGEQGLIISHGLNAGEWIVTAGVSRIRDGQQVRLPGFAQPKPQSAEEGLDK